MRRLVVTDPGLLTTVQDLGRPGWAHIGVSTSGAADPLALRVGNFLVGNPEGAAGLEMTLTGGTFSLEEEVLVAVTGADLGARLDGQPLGGWRSAVAPAGARIEFGQARNGARGYLCLAGGIELPPIFGSRSTHLTSGLGGPGRALRAGDVLPIGPARPGPAAGGSGIDPGWIAARYGAGPLRITPGPQADWFSGGPAVLTRGAWVVTDRSNRMGLRLTGPPIERVRPEQLLTEGAPVGAIQVPDDGQPIILFVEHGTTGGYPKIAGVTSVDLHRVGQLRPRDPVTFRIVDLDEARRLLLEQESEIAGLRAEPGR